MSVRMHNSTASLFDFLSTLQCGRSEKDLHTFFSLTDFHTASFFIDGILPNKEG